MAILKTAYDPKREGLIWVRAKTQVSKLLSQGHGVLLDATSVSRAKRRPWIVLAQGLEVPAYAIALYGGDGPSVGELQQRNAERERTVPAEKLAEYAEGWEHPSVDEGFAGVWTVVGR